MDMIARFERKFIPEPMSGCWLWLAYLRPDGYGEIRSPGGRSGRTLLAHRASYELYKWPIPEGLELDHLCRCRSCVNPDHLEAVTRHVNIMRGDNPDFQRARFAAITHCPQGHPYSLKNTYITIKADGYRNRRCRACARERAAARRGKC